MGLAAAMNNAMSGLRMTQAGMEVVSTNVANAGSAGYSRRIISPVESVAGGRSAGVLTGNVQRVLDQVVQRQLRLETSGAGYTTVRADFAKALDQLFGQPGGVNALDTQVNAFRQSLQALQASPLSARSEVISAASSLAGQLNRLSDSVQDLRRGAENAIASGVDRANDLLSQLTRVNSEIVGYPDGEASPALLDQRDRIINDLSGLMDVRVSETADGSVSVFTTGGLQLFDGRKAAQLQFTPTPNINPNSAYSTDPAQSTLGTIRALDGSGGSVDMLASRALRSGELAAYVEQRDQVLVQAQRQLDELAAGLSRALSDQQRTGAAVTAGAATGFEVDIAGLQAGNVISLSTTLTPSGVAQRFSFVRADGVASLPGDATAATGDQVFPIDMSGGMAGVVTQIQTALGAGYTVSAAGTTLRIVDDGAGNTTNVTGLSAAVTQTNLAGGTTELPFFTDGAAASTPYTGSFNGGSQLTGFAQRIAVNQALVADPSRLVVYGAGVPSGDPTRPTALLDKLSNTILTFSPATGVGGMAQFNGTVSAFARRTIETQGAAAEAAISLNEGQQVALSTVQGRYAEESGVNIDQEMAQLVQLQTAYSANARIITAAKEMMDMLLRI